MAFYDGELLIQNLGKILNELADTKMSWSEVAIKIGQAIKDTPTADVVEVVRCEKCKYGDVSIISKAKDGEEDIACYCTLKKVVTNIDSYCPSGRRRDT